MAFSLVLCGRLTEEAQRLRSEIERQQAETRKVRTEAQNAITELTAEARSEIERLKNSTSWQVTRPLRSLKHQLKAFLAIFNRII